MKKATPLQFGNPVFAKPKEGRKVRKEDGAQLPAEGATVTHSSYYLRRQKDGDLTLSEVAETKAPAAVPGQAEKKSSK